MATRTVLDYTPIIITCTGFVRTRPRLVNKIKPQSVVDECLFSIKFRDAMYGELDLDPSSYFFQKYADKVRSIFETEGIYTDKDGVLCYFDKPDHKVWWIEVDKMQVKSGKPVYREVEIEEPAVEEPAAQLTAEAAQE